MILIVLPKLILFALMVDSGMENHALMKLKEFAQVDMSTMLESVLKQLLLLVLMVILLLVVLALRTHQSLALTEVFGMDRAVSSPLKVHAQQIIILMDHNAQ